MITLDEFVKKYTGVKNVGNTAENKGQCVGLVSVWMDNLGKEHVWGHAKDLFNNADVAEWNKVLNTPLGVPQKGDVIVWKATAGNPYGHTAIFLDGNVMTFRSFDQNLPTGSAPHIQWHTYKDVLGWLKPRDIAQEKIDQIKSVINANLSSSNKLERIREIVK